MLRTCCVMGGSCRCGLVWRVMVVRTSIGQVTLSINQLLVNSRINKINNYTTYIILLCYVHQLKQNLASFLIYIVTVILM